MAKRTAADRVAEVRRLMDRNRSSMARARKDFDTATRKGQAERAAAAKVRIAKYRRLMAAKAAVEAKYAAIAGIDPLAARVIEKARRAKPAPKAEPEQTKPKRKGKPMPVQQSTPRQITAAEPVPVRVPAPWAFGHTDQAEMRVTPSIRQLANRGDLDSRQVRAAGWVRSVIEAASASGVSGIDYSAIKVDTSTKGGAPMMDAVLCAREAHGALALRLGSIGYHVVRGVAYTGLTLSEVAASWPTATVIDGSADKSTRDFIGRTFRESLLIIAEDFCSGIDPNRRAS